MKKRKKKDRCRRGERKKVTLLIRKEARKNYNNVCRAEKRRVRHAFRKRKGTPSMVRTRKGEGGSGGVAASRRSNACKRKKPRVLLTGKAEGTGRSADKKNRPPPQRGALIRADKIPSNNTSGYGGCRGKKDLDCEKKKKEEGALRGVRGKKRGPCLRSGTTEKPVRGLVRAGVEEKGRGSRNR